MPTRDPERASPLDGNTASSRRPEILAAVIWIASAAALVCLFRSRLGIFAPYWFQNGWHGQRWYQAAWVEELRVRGPFSVTAYLLAPTLFLLASTRVFARRTAGYVMGLAAALMAWPFFFESEFANFRAYNSWLVLNGPVLGADNSSGPARWMILAVALLLLATFYSLLRLAPARWRLRRRPLRERTWPAFGMAFLAIAAWYLSAVVLLLSGTHLLICDAVQPWVRVTHVEKRGLHLRETTVIVYRDRKLYITRDDRSLFVYRFEIAYSLGQLPDGTFTSLVRIVGSPGSRLPAELLALPRPRYRFPRAWNSDRWFVFFDGAPGANLYGVEESAVPKEFSNLVRLSQSLPTRPLHPLEVRDICLGFCYDPLR
jgi:uncharacterized membrane protein YhaH (DUF805 family)